MRDVPKDELVVDEDEVTELQKTLLNENIPVVSKPPTLFYMLRNAFQMPRLT